MRPCACSDIHERRRLVLTGGPGAGKTAVLEMIRQHFCKHVKVLPEAAGILFGGGFPRENFPAARQAAQRAIFHIQHELETIADLENPGVVLCTTRGTVDGSAYWTGAGDLDFQIEHRSGSSPLRRRDSSAYPHGDERLQPFEPVKKGVG